MCAGCLFHSGVARLNGAGSASGGRDEYNISLSRRSRRRHVTRRSGVLSC